MDDDKREERSSRHKKKPVRKKASGKNPIRKRVKQSKGKVSNLTPVSKTHTKARLNNHQPGIDPPRGAAKAGCLPQRHRVATAKRHIRNTYGKDLAQEYAEYSAGSDGYVEDVEEVQLPRDDWVFFDGDEITKQTKGAFNPDVLSMSFWII